MINLNNTENTLKEMKRELLNNATIRKLLYVDSAYALEAEDPGYALLDEGNYIVCGHLMSYSIDKTDRNTFVSITLPQIDFDDANGIVPLFQIACVSNYKTQLLANNNLRLVRLVNEIIQTLHEKKFSSAITPYVRYVKEFVISDDISATGYIITLNGYDDSTTGSF